MLLYLVRHAWAGQSGDPEYPDDNLRPLTPEGKKRFAKVVKELIQRGFAPELVASSPLVRAEQTAQIIVERFKRPRKIVIRNELAPPVDLKSLLQWQQQAEVSSAAWVGHAPDIGQMVGDLIGDRGAQIRFAKGAVAAIKFDGPLDAGPGILQWLVTAKMLGC